jgi:hypothetical protein
MAFERLRDLPTLRDDNGSLHPVCIPFSEKAADVLQAFRVKCRDWGNEAEGLLAGHIGKMPGHSVRLACVLAHLDWAHDNGAGFPDRIEVDHIERACQLVGGHYRLHAYRSYGNSRPPEEIRNARRIAIIIEQERPRQFKVRDIQNRNLSGIQSAKQVKEALCVLEQADWVRRSAESSGGRPSVNYTVNPKLWR